MAVITPTRSQQILVDTPESAKSSVKVQFAPFGGAALAGWIITKVNTWEEARARGYQRIWGEYWRLWRGQWNEADKNRMSERSKLVTPALSQAIDQTVSEIEEAIFNSEEWLDVDENPDPAKQAMQLLLRDQLIDDLELVNFKDNFMESVLSGAITGELIAKCNVYVGNDNKPTRDSATFELKTQKKERVYVSVESIRPDEFIPDPVGRNVEQMLGCAHRMSRTLHYAMEACENGRYDKRCLAQLAAGRRMRNFDIDQEDPMSVNTTYESEQIDIVEYHGKVPAKMLIALKDEGRSIRSPLDEALDKDMKTVEASDGSGPLVEAIVTVINGSVIARAMINPFVTKNRSIIACPFERVPGRFWGRGVAEKGYNPQKALDAEVRARMDALGYIGAPMLGIDSGRIPRGFKLEVKPGKVWLTQGNPDEVLRPVKIGDLTPLTFEQTQEMERMVQMGTGAFDTATALKAQSQSGAAAASSNSGLMGAFVKRSKRAINNICRNFLQPIVEMALWRYMQFDPARYPQDFDVKIKTALGIVAREVEAAQMTQLMGMMPQEFHQVQLVLAKGIISHTSLHNKAEILKIIDGVVNPSPAQQQQMQKQQQMQEQAQAAQLDQITWTTKKLQAEVTELQGRAAMHVNEASIQAARTRQDWTRIQMEGQENQQFARQNDIAALRLHIDNKKADAALMAARKKPSGSAK